MSQASGIFDEQHAIGADQLPFVSALGFPLAEFRMLLVLDRHVVSQHVRLQIIS
jgi:hypothetical protein